MLLKFVPKSRSFLGCDVDFKPTEKSKAIVIPCGIEASVSYGSGAKKGPAAIISASQQVELFDEEFWQEPYRQYGVATLEKFPFKKSFPAALAQITEIVGQVLAENKFPLILGGEHSLTPAAVKAFTKKFGEISILHFDAHADLRDGYLGEKFSHAAAIRRCLDNSQVVKVVSVGVRSISAEEIPFLEANPQRIQIFWTKDKSHWRLAEILKALPAQRPVYLSFDLDAFDPSLLPATGTPEPGGLFWDEALTLIREIAKNRNIIGADIVELAPIKNLPASEFIAAKLAYKVLNYALRE